MPALLKLNDVSVSYQTPRGELKAVQHVDLAIEAGETLGLVGESGCGKSTLARCVVGLNHPTSGEVLVDNLPLGTKLDERRKSASKVQMVFQNALSSLNPRLVIEKIIEQPLVVHKIGNRSERKARVLQLIDQVGLGRHHLDKYPHELSGGQRQRVSIARALTLRPKLLVCDEAVSALDVSVQAQVLNLLVTLQRETRIAILFISHDLSVVRFVSDRIAVMYLGRIVEIGPAESLWNDTLHPYTSVLLASNPDRTPDEIETTPRIDGDPPSPINPPSGCAFRTRCPYARQVCTDVIPVLSSDELPHAVACHFASEIRSGKAVNRSEFSREVV